MSDIHEYDRAYEGLAIKDRENPRSLVNLLPSFVADRIKAIPDEFFLMTENELRRAAEATDTDEFLRISFWEEYRRAMRVGNRINCTNIYGGVCNKKWFEEIVGNSYKLLFMITPPMEVQIQMESMLHLALEEWTRMLKMPVVGRDGKYNAAIANCKIKIGENLLNRRRGETVNKSEIVSKSLNVNVDKRLQSSPASAKSLDEIEREIKELEQLNQIAAPTQVIDIIPETRDVQEV